MITTLTETWGFDGTPNAGTIVNMKVTLETSWFVSFIMFFVGDHQIRSALDTGVYLLAEHAKKLPSASQYVKSTLVDPQKSPVQTSLQNTETKNIEAAQKLDLKKEAEKKLKQKETGYTGINKEQNELEKQLKLAKEKVEKARSNLQQSVSKVPSIETITVSTDKSAYTQNEILAISGVVNSPKEGVLVTLRILDPTGKIVGIDQFSPNSDGTLSRSYVTNGPLWTPSGKYTIIVQYGFSATDETTFDFRVSQHRIQPHITLDPIPSSVNVGNVMTFSGRLYLQEIPQNTVVYIKEEDPFDEDDFLAAATVQSDGRFSANWKVQNVDADRVADIYAVFEGSYPHYPRLTTCGDDCTNTIKLRIN